MALLQEAPWIDLLATWISEETPHESKKELQVLLQDLDIAVTMADSLVECSEQLQRIAHQWTQKHDKLEANS